MARKKNGHGKSGRALSDDGRARTTAARTAPAPAIRSELPLSDTLKRHLVRATCERNVRAVSFALCRGWGEDPNEEIPVCDRAGRPTGKTVARWTSFRGEAVAAITAFVMAEDDADNPVDIAEFVADFMRRAG